MLLCRKNSVISQLQSFCHSTLALQPETAKVLADCCIAVCSDIAGRQRIFSLRTNQSINQSINF